MGQRTVQVQAQVLVDGKWMKGSGTGSKAVAQGGSEVDALGRKSSREKEKVSKVPGCWVLEQAGHRRKDARTGYY